ncbi:MAG: cytochrome c3 family protein [Nitrospirota bacterium]
MRRIFFPLLFILASSLFPAGRAVAGIIGSPHDIGAQKYTVFGQEEDKKNVCNYCHVPHKAKGIRLWATTPPSLRGWGRVGPLCYSCHDGVSIVSPNVDASNTAFNPRSHGLKLSKLPKGDSAAKSGLPYTNPKSAPAFLAYSGNNAASSPYASITEDYIECSTCHNPHDDTNRPFLRVAITDICEKCHQGRENSGYGINNTESTHPVHNLPKDENGGPSPINVQDDFKVRFPGPYPTEDGKDAVGVHWTLGGHLSSGDQGTIECVTCHSVHGKQGIGPVADKLLTVDPVKDNADLFCEGCHQGQRADNLPSPPYPNPGGTTAPRSYHPADNDMCNGPGRIVQINTPPGWVFGKNGEILCTTCHKPHRGLVNSPILRPPVTSPTFCEECHSTPFAHHPTGNFGTVLNSGKPHAATREPIIPSNFPVGITYGKPGNALYCSSCHKAHNSLCPPILVFDCTNGDLCDLCITCHPKFNPTWQTDDNFKSTHFMGDPTASVIDKVTVLGTVFGTQNGYYDQNPPINLEAWPESKMFSTYGKSGRDITCCSCHNFGVGNITAGDADESPFLGPILDPAYQPSDLTSGLLARAGKSKEWLLSDIVQFVIGGERGTINKVDKYLCTGCHGLTPNSHPNVGVQEEGFTHQLMIADGSKITPVPPAHLTFNKHVNCEDCHSVHEADSRGGFYILRDVDYSANLVSGGQVSKFTNISSLINTILPPDPYVIRQRSDIEFAPLCQKCHIGY